MKDIFKKTIFLLSVIVITFISYQGFDFYKDFYIKKNKQTQTNKEIKIPFQETKTILVLGADSLVPGKLAGWRGRSDFIAVVFLDPNQDKVHIMSVPRDTKVSLKNYDINRINAANQLGGYKFAKRAVNQLLGIKIDHVFVFSLEAALEMFDTLGEVKIFVPQEMYYNDNKANLHINIKPGLQTMDARELMNFVRFRNKDRGDIARIERQQVFFRAALRKIKEPEVVFRIPDFLFKANKVFQTDMDFSEMFQLGLLFRSMELEDIESHIVPGDFGSDGSWIVKKLELQAIMDSIKHGYKSQANSQKKN